MSENPWMKFYPRDWRGDQALRACSLAARGLWIECLCIMHEAKPYGHLLLNGEPISDETLARMVGAPVDEVSAMLAELRQAGVLSVTGDGIVRSRRMTKDHGRAKKGSRAAKKRWSKASENKEENPSPNGLPNRSPNGMPITQKPEARSQKVESNRQRLVQRAARAVSTRWPLPVWHFTGQDVADAWAADGIGEAAVSAAVDRICAREFEAGKQPPKSLRYFDSAVREAAAEAIADRQYLATLSKPKDPYVAAVERWERGGCQGPPPRPEDFPETER